MKLLNGHRLLVQDLHSWFLYQASISAGKIFNCSGGFPRCLQVVVGLCFPWLVFDLG